MFFSAFMIVDLRRLLFMLFTVSMSALSARVIMTGISSSCPRDCKTNWMSGDKAAWEEKAVKKIRRIVMKIIFFFSISERFQNKFGMIILSITQ